MYRVNASAAASSTRAEAPPGAKGVVARELGEVRVGAGRVLVEDLRPDLGELRLAGERQGELLEHEAVELGVEERDRVAGGGEREAGGAQARDDGVVVGQRRRAGRAPRVHEADAPPVPQEDLAGGDRAPSKLLAPGPRGVGAVELPEDDVDHRVEESLLVRHVVVERHRLDAEPPGERAHREGGEALGVGERDGGGHDGITAQSGAAGRRRQTVVAEVYLITLPGQKDIGTSDTLTMSKAPS